MATPLQGSCLENSRDGGACWAAVYGVAQSRTRLKRLSSSSSSSSLNGSRVWGRMDTCICMAESLSCAPAALTALLIGYAAAAAAAAKPRQSCPTLCDPRRQPTRLPRPWDSPGKNTGVGCHFLLQCMKVKSEGEVAQLCPTQQPHGLQPTRLLHPLGFPVKSTGVGCHCLLCNQLYSNTK